MNRYITGAVIRKLRESKRMTQEELAEKIFVSGKAVSKWETGQGFPDISLLEPLARALDISVIELLSGEDIRNRNRAADMGKVQPADNAHLIRAEIVEDEYFVTLDHPMTRDHYISFLAAVSDQGVQFVKLYPEGNAGARFKIDRVSRLYAYCNRHGLFQAKPVYYKR